MEPHPLRGIMNPRSIAFVGASNNLFKMGTIQFSQMVRGDREFMAGMSRLLGFPPSIMFGLGGVFAEALKDRAIRLAPLDRDDVFSMRESLNGAALLGPYRSMAPVGMDALADILAALGEPALHIPVIRETDLDPIITVDGRPIVADAVMAI